MQPEEDNMKFVFEQAPSSAVIKVIGVGGCGGNAVLHMIRNHVEGVEFICANTDAQALHNTKARTVLQLGSKVTNGLGAGADPDAGRQAAMEDRDQIAETIDGADMVFVTAGMGGGTGTGAAPVIAEVAKEMRILTVAVVTRPFDYENRSAVADRGVEQLAEKVDSLIIIPNQKLQDVLGEDVPLLKAFAEANDILLGAVRGIADLIMRPGMINVDFADVRTVMSEMGPAMMGTGEGSGGDRAVQAAEAAINNPLLEGVHLQGARGMLVNITAGESLTLGEFNKVGERVGEYSADDAKVVVGTAIDPALEEEMKVTVVATGIGRPRKVVDNTGRGGLAKVRMPGDYSGLEEPAIHRRDAGGAPPSPADGREERDFLDIPAFLRRQAD